MSLRFYCFFFLLLCHYSLSAQDKIPVFTSGQEGHATYRIPAIISVPNGDLLAFAEGRVKGSADFGDINLVLKRSSDRGKSWSSLQTLVDYDSLQAGNPAPVVDLLDPAYPKGVVYLFYNTGNNHEYEVRLNQGLREIWVIKSFDLGSSWTSPENITTQVHRLNHPAANPAYTHTADWRHYANTPGHAIQITEGHYKGRLYVAANHSVGDPQERFREYRAHGFYSDDHGKSYRLSESLTFPGSNESTAAPLSGDRLLMSVRNQEGTVRQRILAYSSDGGSTWEEEYFEPQLPDPVCQGSLLALGSEKGKTILAHSNAADPKDRNHLTVKISTDEGRTWDRAIPIDSSSDPKKSSWTAYSDLVLLDPATLGILYERDNYREIIFHVFPWR
uniref:sialidase family protein n=1 Tax=Algoriphagus sp. TaxID=1872435 RepID=UPI0040480719